MKRLATLFLVMMMTVPTMVYASIDDQQAVEQESVKISSIQTAEAQSTESIEQVQARNIEYLTYNHLTYSNGYTYHTIRPGMGEHLKLHIYLENGGSLQYWIKEVGKYYWQPIAIIDQRGHNYRDLVVGTSGQPYELRVLADAVMYSGGVYSGN